MGCRCHYRTVGWNDVNISLTEFCSARPGQFHSFVVYQLLDGFRWRRSASESPYHYECYFNGVTHDNTYDVNPENRLEHYTFWLITISLRPKSSDGNCVHIFVHIYQKHLSQTKTLLLEKRLTKQIFYSSSKVSLNKKKWRCETRHRIQHICMACHHVCRHWHLPW